MKRSAWNVGGGALVALAVGAVTALVSAAPWTPVGADRSILRLSWRATGSLIEECRRPTDAENARLPAHMRRDEICEGRASSFVLTVAVDGTTVLRDTLDSEGARGDRPVHVLREIEVDPGAHDVRVAFEALLPEAPAAGSRPAEFPANLELTTRAEVGAGDIVLITYDPAERTLVKRPL